MNEPSQGCSWTKFARKSQGRGEINEEVPRRMVGLFIPNKSVEDSPLKSRDLCGLLNEELQLATLFATIALIVLPLGTCWAC